MIDTKHIIGGLIGMALTAGIAFLSSKGIEVQCPSASAPAAQVSSAAK